MHLIDTEGHRFIVAPVEAAAKIGLHLVRDDVCAGTIARHAVAAVVPRRVHDRGPAPFDGLAGAVSALRIAGLVHRDIKPENILLIEGGERLVLLDLGIAREIDAPASTTTQAGMVRGTPAYMAPERFFGSPASVAPPQRAIASSATIMVAPTSRPIVAAVASAAVAPVDLPQCRKLLALYGSPGFNATDVGGQRTLWQPTWASYLAAPAEQRPAIEVDARSPTEAA